MGSISAFPFKFNSKGKSMKTCTILFLILALTIALKAQSIPEPPLMKGETKKNEKNGKRKSNAKRNALKKQKPTVRALRMT